MRAFATVLVVFALVAIVGALASAQQLSQPDSVKQVLYNYDYDYDYADDAALPNEGKLAPPEKPAEPAKIDSGCSLDCGTCDTCMSCAACDPNCGRGCNWLGIKTSGWIQAGITGNGNDPADRFSGPQMTNDRVGEPMLNELWFSLERPINTENGFDVGGRFDLLYGTDWRVADCYGNGFEDRMNGPRNLYGLAFPLMYVEAGKGDFSAKVGRMAGILGYESVVPMMNFFYSHSYAMCYAEPILITGVMGKYALSETIDVLAGFHNGLHQFENDNGDLNFQGGVRWTSCDKRTSLAYCLDAGRNDLAALQDTYMHSIVFQRQLSCRWQYVFQSDYGYENQLNGLRDAEWYGINQYLFYQINAKWKAGMRVEWFRDDEGTRVFGVGNLPDARGWMGAPGYEGSFTELTMGLNWKPKDNIWVRPEVRWDWYDGPANPNGPNPYPYDDGTKLTQFTFGCDFVMTF